MTTITKLDTPRNRLLAAIPDDELDAVLEHLEPVDLEFGQVLIEIDQPIEHVYFPEGALVSMIGTDSEGAAVEVVMIGRDGMVGMPLFFGTDRTLMQAFVQIPGNSWRMSAQRFRETIARTAPLERILWRYAQALFYFAAQSSACNRLHSVMQRCARWLLTTQDAVGASQFRLTHLVLAQMLGVRRATVTDMAALFTDEGILDAGRGVMRILDGAALERSSCECYRVLRTEYDRLLGGEPGEHGTPADGRASRSPAH
jgi:CRP-like cAMP-binding protein